ncbi:MAG: hypothetical protein IKH58_11260 [Bacteroidales bacterium]|nr:hypothetical protein [Bacteroidales bacterium]
MRFPRFIALSLSLLLPAIVHACGWWPSHSGEVLLYRIMPLDEAEYYDYAVLWSCDNLIHRKVDYKADNLLLWQRQTSRTIPVADIERIVYHADADYLLSLREQPCPSSAQDNAFICWILAHQRTDILDFLILAKQNEEVRLSMTDPWYYDVKDSYHYRVLEEVVRQCRLYTKGPLLGRYALQMMRALCSLRDYQTCADYWDSVKGHLNDDAIRKMAELRAAAALCKVDRRDEAFEIYVRYGDLASIRAVNGGQIDNELEFVYDRCPDSPYLAEEVQKWLLCTGDDEKTNMLLNVAHRAVKEKKSHQQAMWYYTLAALYDMKGATREARKYLQLGQRYPKDPYLRDTYRVMRIWLDAKTATCDDAYERQLMSDLRWLAGKIRREATPEVFARLHRYDDWGIADDEDDDHREVYQLVSNTFYWNDAMRRILFKAVCPRMHEARKYVREIQLANLAENLLVKTKGYAGEMFAIIDRLPYDVTRQYYTRIYQPLDEFDSWLNHRGKTDRNYWYDILATKCLRERRYATAIYYLRKVPVEFQQRLNVYEYMHRNPFSYDMETFVKDRSLAPDYKLRFAEAMLQYERTMKSDRDPNKRADAKIQYALGLRNSVHKCWFLTRHSSNLNYNSIRDAVPEIPYPVDSTLYRHDEYLKLSTRLINEAILTYTDRDQAARQLRHLLYYRRLLTTFPDTPTAHDLRARCDEWRDYKRIFL